MVLGLKTKNKKNPYVQLEYIINLIEIKPWPPSQSLRSLRSALIQWEHSDKNSGSTKLATPSTASISGVGDGKIAINESFKVHVTLSRDPSRDDESFLRNCMELNMFETRRDKTVKGQLLATAIIDFAEYGVVEGSLDISVPMNCKRMFGKTGQPMLFVNIQTASFRESLIREGSMDTNRSESVSALMNEEYAEEAEFGSVTDDDISSQSSLVAGSLTLENGHESKCGTLEKLKKVSVQDKRAAYEKHISSSNDLYIEVENARTTLSNIRNSRFTTLPRKAFSNDDKIQQLLEASQSGQQSQTVGDKLKNMNSVGSSSDSCVSNGSMRSTKVIEKLKNADVSKVQLLEHRVHLLESELVEAAAIEFSIYSVVAEHGSNFRKVHASARRLSRLYIHACGESSLRRSNSERSIVSGLILVAKACGNDVARLTFWLSNCVVLRAMIHKTIEKDSDDRDGVCVIISDLEKVESWMFSRIVESIWWQIMEQCISRLDVAMFNAILREPGDEIPTDPVSDPISDSSVLPIPSGQASVGAGAMLKRTIGNWSSWLADLFGSPITFHLLTSLSELMMLPKDMILSNTIRNEVCPSFGVRLIKKILDNFTPDEFCPDPLPEVVLEALDSEDLLESGEACVMSLPCAASPIVYRPTSASLIGCILGDDRGSARLSRSGSSILQKSNTSDDELDELESPLTSIVDSSRVVDCLVKPVWSLKNVDSCSHARYRLLREAWMNSD